MADHGYIARYQGFKTSAYPTRDEAALAMFTLCNKAKRCSTSRATLINGEVSDAGGFDIWDHSRYNYPAAGALRYR
jgi:hypothetical protein